MKQVATLADLAVGERARVIALCAKGGMRRRLLDIGLIENTWVECLGKNPSCTLCSYHIRGAVIALRKADGKNVLVEGEGCS